MKTAEQLEQAILEAAQENADCLYDLLQEAIETMDGARVDRLLDKVHQIMSESLRDAQGWKEEVL